MTPVEQLMHEMDWKTIEPLNVLFRLAKIAEAEGTIELYKKAIKYNFSARLNLIRRLPKDQITNEIKKHAASIQSDRTLNTSKEQP